MENNEEKLHISKKTVLREILDWAKSIAIGMLVGVFIVVFVAQKTVVDGNSMESTLYDGEVLFAEKVSTYFNSFDRGDIIIFDAYGLDGNTKKEDYVKRIIGLPGETVKIENNMVFIKKVGSDKFELLDEPYLTPGTITVVSPYGVERGYNLITLGEDEYFCMGDNRGVSNDSRRLGPISSDRIRGRAVVRTYPFNTFKIF